MLHEKEIERVKKYYTTRIEDHKKNPSSPSMTLASAYMVKRKEEAFLKGVKCLGIKEFATKSLLEVGCGGGSWIAKWTTLGIPQRSLYGVDIMEEYVDASKKLTPFPENIHAASITHLPFADEAFDLVSQSTLFTSILDPQARQKGAQELLRVLKKGGYVFWYDFRYPSPQNPNVRQVNKKELYTLFPHCKIYVVSLTLLPPLLRRVAPLSLTLCSLLEKIPFLRSHYLAIIQKMN